MLLQIVLHARLAEDLPDGERWNVDDVAGGLVDKMVRRNPHVFAGEQVDDARGDHRELGADQAGREVPRLRAGRHRAEPAGAGPGRQDPAAGGAGGLTVPLPDGPDLGSALLGWSPRRGGGLDAEAALRRAALEYADAVRAAERKMSDRPSNFLRMPEFVPLAERIVDALLESDPGLASYAGDHRFDDRLPDLSPGAVADRVDHAARRRRRARPASTPTRSTPRTRSTTRSSPPWSSATCSS